MPSTRGRAAVFVLLGLVVVGGLVVFIVPEAIAPADENYDRTTVTAVEANVTIDVRVADTARKRHVGLSATDSLDDGEGMLFVHETEGEYTYVMRGMSFPLDIVFIDADGRITEIHHAPVPAARAPTDRYTGTGKYVLEVPEGYTNQTGIEVGHRVEIADD